MSTNEKETTSDDIRKRGNDLYKAGKLREAAVAYQEAAEKDPTSAAPLSNLAAARFELGQYDAAILACDAALTLLDDGPEHDVSRQKLALRKAKSCLFSKRFEEGLFTLTLCSNDQEKSDLNRSLRAYQGSKPFIADSAAVNQKLILELPRFKPSIRETQEYFCVGNDSPEPLYDDQLLHTGRDKISLMFAGVGDARNLFFTLTIIGAGAKMGTIPRNKRFHFTVLDHKAVVIARDLILLRTIDDLTKLPRDSDRRTYLLYLLYYLYISPIMPRYIYNILQVQIKKLIAGLEDEELLPSFLDVPTMYRSDILRVLKEWQHDTFADYPTHWMRTQAISQFRAQQLQWGPGMAIAPEDCSKQIAFYRSTGIVMLSSNGHDDFLDTEVPGLTNAYKLFNKGDPEELSQSILDHVDANWASNVTMIDLQWQRTRQLGEMSIDLSFSPFELGYCLEGMGFDSVYGDANGLFDHVEFFFSGVVLCLASMKNRIKVEACIGDILGVLEQIRSGVVGHREQRKTLLDGEPTAPPGVGEEDSSRADRQSPLNDNERSLDEYPTIYDRIHLSNIPDYIGGTLTSFLYALPLIWPDVTSYITSNCLRNPPRWKSVAHFNNEYIGLSAPLDLENTFGVQMAVPQREDENPFPLTQYNIWHRVAKKILPSLMPREKLEKWLYRVFLKLAIPKEKEMASYTLIYSPLNLSVFIRLCGHLESIGYPAHWISGILNSLCSGRIVTKARPPRSEPLKIKEVKTDVPALKQSTMPFVAEMTTLLSIFQTTLPFGVLIPQLPILNTIKKYAYALEEAPLQPVPDPNHFVLVFMDADMRIRFEGDLRLLLLSDELADRSKEAQLWRERGVHVLTTWNWDRINKTVSFWMREDFMQSMRAKNWTVSIWRTDSWIEQSPMQDLDDIEDLGATWLGPKV